MSFTTSDPSCRALRRAGWVLAILLSGGAAMAQPPTVNGLFYGDGDNTRYSPYATSNGGSVLYSYYDAPTTTLYVALVVNQAVNDLVCSPRTNADYTASATPPWGVHRSCKRGSDSEFAGFTFECAQGSPRSWSWQQALGCALNTTDPPSNWVSQPNPPCGPSTAASTWPPGIVATSSWVADVNTYQSAAPATRAWNLYAFGTDIDRGWKSPFVASAPNNVTQVPGYPTYSTTNGSGLVYNWEWSMVYEWSLNIGPTGVDCGNQPIFFISGSSHHSPPKMQPPGCNTNDDCFPPPTGDATFSDWGDLPASYSTTAASGGARHYLKVSGPYLGQSIQSELDGVPTADATGDGAEEDGVTVNVTGNWTPGSTQSITVVVANAPSGALLGGWFDWNNDGDLADPGEFFTWNVVNGSNTLNLTVGAGFSWQTNNLYARFRLFSGAAAAPGGSLDQGDFAGLATDGEVEDYRYPVGALPVTLNAFSTEGAPGGEITVRWQTASETDNVAFELWGMVDGKWQAMTDLVASQKVSSALPQGYETKIAAPAGLTAVKLVDYDTAGRAETFGSFALGGSYGEFQPVETIDWSGPRAERDAELARLGFADTTESRSRASARAELRSEGGKTGLHASRWKKVHDGKPLTARPADRLAIPIEKFSDGRGAESNLRKPGAVEIATGPLTHVAVTATGIQRVSYETLRGGGLDLAGEHARDIAVTWRGEPVERWIDGPEKFGPGSAIEFLGKAPEGEDARYIDTSLYQVSVDRSRARSAGGSSFGRAKSFSSWYLKEAWVDRPLFYHHQSPTGDPWVDRTVLVQGGRPPAVVTLDLPVEGPVSDGLSHLVVGLGTITDLPDLRDGGGQVLPEHNVEVWLRGPDGSRTFVTTASTSGQSDWRIEAALPAGLLEPGLNQVELRFSTDYLFSLVVVDRYGVLYPTPYRGPRLDFAPDRLADGYRIDGFRTPSVAAYAEGEDGSLTRVGLRVSPSGGAYSVEFRRLDAKRFWITEAPRTPAVFTTQAPPDLLADSADLVVIAGSGFVNSPALADYLAQRAAFNPVVVDVEDIYNAVGYGMALPSAITDYLAARNAIHPFTHVQLVGADCYDRRNYVSQCVSFLPLPTVRVGASFYTPSQNRLIDLDGDGVGDKAVAQFSVRDETELATIVGKGAAWEASRQSVGGSALLIAEETDGTNDFEAQIERLGAQLGWNGTDVLRMAEHPDIQTARDALRSDLDEGRAVTTFSGHSSPSVWAFRALLTPATVADLTNVGRPTIMVPLACEATYDISPNANVLGHQLLFGGDQGALAISGAVALANLTHNERMASHVLNGLKAGLTLGEAVLAGRRALGSSYQELQDNWITQGDVAVALVP